MEETRIQTPNIGAIIIIPSKNDSPYERLPVWMTPRTNDSILRIVRTKVDTGNGIATVYRLKYLTIRKTESYTTGYCHSLLVKII